MKKKSILLKTVSLAVAVILIAAMGLIMTSCKAEKDFEQASMPSASNQSASDTASASDENRSPNVDGYGSAAMDIGYGATNFIFRVTDKEGNDTIYRIHTDKTVVGEALQDYEMIAGAKGDYGLYVKTVTGRTYDYDKDKCYWAFYVDSEYAAKGVDQTEIVVGQEYCFKVEK